MRGYSSQTSPALLLARVLMASVFLVMGAWRLLGMAQGVPLSDMMLAISIVEAIVGLLLLAGWRLRWTAMLAAALVLADAVASHRFWGITEPARTAQLLHFMKNLGLVGGLLLLSSGSGRSRR